MIALFRVLIPGLARSLDLINTNSRTTPVKIKRNSPKNSTPPTSHLPNISVHQHVYFLPSTIADVFFSDSEGELDATILQLRHPYAMRSIRLLQ